MSTFGKNINFRPLNFFYTWQIILFTLVIHPLAQDAPPPESDGFYDDSLRFTVPLNGLTCEEIAQRNQLPIADLLYINSETLQNKCGLVTDPKTISEGTIVDIPTRETENSVPCNVVYTTLEGDSCSSIASKFSLPSKILNVFSLEDFNAEIDFNCSDHSAFLEPNQLICVDRSLDTKKEMSLGKNYVVTKWDRGCDLIYKNKTTPLDFFYLNPGIDCGNLTPGDQLRMAPTTVQKCGKICTIKTKLLGNKLCTDIKVKYYKNSYSIWCKYDNLSYQNCLKFLSLKGTYICHP